MGFQELALLLLLFLPLCSAQSTYYITPTPDTPCPGEPCYNFSAVVDYLTPDAVLVFLPGNYTLEIPIFLTNLNSLTLAGNSSSRSLPQVTTSIRCSQEAHIVYTNITELFITDIAFVSCGYPSVFMFRSADLDQVLYASISNCIFQSGHLTVINSNVDLFSNKFDNNSALYSAGGALAIDSSHINLSGNIFTHNIATSTHGGGVYMVGSTANISGNMFINNSASGWGGGMYLENSMVSFNNNLFENNTFLSESKRSSGGGGALAIRRSHVNISDNSFTNNSANSTHGGGVFMKDSTANISRNMFMNNHANRWGGGVYLENSTVSFNSNSFKNNTARYGGGIEAYSNSIVNATNNNFTRNIAGVAGGGIAIYVRVEAKFVGNILEYNEAQRDGGGGIAATSDNRINFTLDSFMFNTASAVGTGGGILLMDSIVNVTESNFTGNSACNRGGGSYLENSTVNFHKNVFISNSALLNGAGIYIASNSDSIDCTNNTFKNNWGDGWVLFIEDSNRTSAVLSQNDFENNTGNVVYRSSNETPSIYHITPSPDTTCPNEPCLTISKFIDQANHYIALNTTLMFLPGTHTVRSGLLIEGITSLTLLGNSSVESLPLIVCDRPASFGFKYIKEFFVHSLAFDSCGDGTYAALSVKSVSRIEISGCSFKNSISNGGALVSENSISTLLTENVFENNSAIVGGGLYVSKSVVNFIGNTFTNNKAEFGGAGMMVLGCNVSHTGAITFISNSVVSIGRQMVNNDREFRESFLSLASVHVETRFTGGAMFIYKSNVTFGNISIESNIAAYGGGVCILSSTISFSGLTDCVNNHAEDSGGAIYAVESSKLYFEGTSNFKSNEALNGGGLYLDRSSLCYFSATARLYFDENLAKEKGGAIYVADATSSVYCAGNSASEDLKSDCFFQIQTDETLGRFGFDIQTMINFSSNIANEGGGDLYGGAIDNCVLSDINLCSDYCDFQSSGDVFNTITTGELDISSVPLQVCSCENQTPDCSQLLPSVQSYPGETFNVFVAVVGQRDATVPTVIQTQISDNIRIPVLQDTQKTTKSQLCSNLSFTVFSAESESSNLTLSIASPCDQNSLMIQIHMQSCPHGFQLSTVNACECDEILTRKMFTESCDIETGTIFRPSGSEFWVGYDIECDSLILHPHCPFDYCTEYEQYVNVDDSDTQCNYNRTGKLCGSCSDTTSLVLGSSRCMQCSNSYLTLIIVFAFAGIALVLFLFILKLTFAHGTINGLIFYANIVQVNSSIFYKSVNTNILTVFISWLNLDLGIETCFYNGMDAYAKTLLQFVFPIYVWSLVGVIIFVSHFSQKIASLLGSNPIAVLATLFLISYAKILRAIIAAFSFTHLEYPYGRVAVWTYDGNLEYFTALSLTASLSFIFLILPFTLLLFFGQWIQTLQAKTEWRILSWINKRTFRAFLYTYHAPYASSHRYWTGLLLLVRLILFIFFATIGNTMADLIAIFSAAIGLIIALATAGIYSNRYFGILEGFFFLNLIFLTGVTYNIQILGGYQAAGTLIFLSIAFMGFAGIVIYHIFLRIRGTKLQRRVASLVKICSSRFSISKKSGDIELVGKEEKIASNEASITSSYVELREPLLDEN